VFERCDLEVTDVIPSVLSAAHAVLTPAEKQSGVILAVLGGAVTHFACYKNSVLLETRSLPFGAEGITEAIAKKLNIDHLDAQKLKETFGSAVSKTEFQEELIPIPDANGRKKYHIQRKEFEAQMSFGLNAYFEEIKREIKTLQGLYAPLTQVVFTGGGARLDGFLEAVQESISPMCRMGTVQGISGPEGLVSNPAFSGVLGGIDFTARLSERGLSPSLRQSWLGRSVETAKNWIFEYL
jgi:cell division protein FtsA